MLIMATVDNADNIDNVNNVDNVYGKLESPYHVLKIEAFSRVKIKYLFTCEKKLKGFQHAHKALWMQLLGIEAQPAKTFTFLILHFNFYIFTFTLSHFYFHNFSVTFTYILTLQYFHYQTFIFTFILTSLKLQH